MSMVIKPEWFLTLPARERQTNGEGNAKKEGEII